MSACHGVIQRGGNVLLLDKNPFLGGNSTKATSGINGALTPAQINHHIKDSWELFAKDTAVGGKVESGKPTPVMETLCRESAYAIDWLQKYFKLDLSLVAQLGGHSVARTHRGPEKFPGMTITYALIEHFELLEKETQGKRAKTVLSARVTRLLTNPEGNTVTGVEYEHEGTLKQAYGPVVLATGGYGADFSENSLLAKARPDLLHLSTTNGDHCTGDGIKMGQSIGANVVGIEYVQVHPTGLVDPADPNSKVKFLAAEALRGVGGLLLNGKGERFVNEMATRDHVSGVMTKNISPFRLVLNTKSCKEIEWHCKHYVGRGLMKRLTGAELAREIGIPVSKLEQVFQKYNEVAKKGIDEYGKKFFQSLPYEVNDVFHVSLVCPLVHYCMGGLEINPEAQVVGKNSKPISGLFGCGETTGGVHHKNRLGGSSLTDCVVYGKIAGESAARYLLSNLSTGGLGFHKNGDAVELVIKQAPLETVIQVNPSSSQVSLNVHWGKGGQQAQLTPAPAVSAPTPAPASAPASAAAPAAAAAPTGAPKPGEKRALKEYTMEEVAKHNKPDDIWVVVNGQVLDVTNFYPKHPGGPKAILMYAGKDASEEFNMIHDPNVIEKYAPYTIIGTLVDKPKSKL